MCLLQCNVINKSFLNSTESSLKAKTGCFLFIHIRTRSAQVYMLSRHSKQDKCIEWINEKIFSLERCGAPEGTLDLKSDHLAGLRPGAHILRAMHI